MGNVASWLLLLLLLLKGARIAFSYFGEPDLPGFATFFYQQTLDHFSIRNTHNFFRQRYLINSEHWAGADKGSPVFILLGGESDILNTIKAVGFVQQAASHFRALLTCIEHRYYGASAPFGSMDQAFNSTDALAFLTIEQALADYAQIVTNLRKNMSADACPFIAIGGSYAGMLATWFRMKYPHLIYGALASSGLLLYSTGTVAPNTCFSIVSKDFNDTSPSCYRTIRESWFEIDRVAAMSDGLRTLSQLFDTCLPLDSSQDLKNALRRIYSRSAQYDTSSVKVLCGRIDGGGSYVLDRIAAGLLFRHSDVSDPCLDASPGTPYQLRMSGWIWQFNNSYCNFYVARTCTELVTPLWKGKNDTMFQASTWEFQNHSAYCKNLDGISPMPQQIPLEFGGNNLTSVLRNSTTNIVFSNGLRDPYSAGGILESVSDTIIALVTENGTHCLYLRGIKADGPDWYLSQRAAEAKILQGWITKFNAGNASIQDHPSSIYQVIIAWVVTLILFQYL